MLAIFGLAFCYWLLVIELQENTDLVLQSCLLYVNIYLFSSPERCGAYALIRCLHRGFCRYLIVNVRVGNLIGLCPYGRTTLSETTLQWYHPTPRWVLEGVSNAVIAPYDHKYMQVVHLYAIGTQMPVNSLTRLVEK